MKILECQMFGLVNGVKMRGAWSSSNWSRNILVAYNVNVNEIDAKVSKIAGSLIRTSGRLISNGKKMR